MTLLRVGPFAADQDGWPHYRACDWCFETACADIWAGRHAREEWRLFYLVVGEGLTVCERCLDAGRLEEE